MDSEETVITTTQQRKEKLGQLRMAPIKFKKKNNNNNNKGLLVGVKAGVFVGSFGRGCQQLLSENGG